MKTIIRIGLLTFLTLNVFIANTQQTPLYTHYMYNTLVINPAYAGSRDALTVTALHRSQWVDYNGAPMTETITIHSPVKNRHIGVGLSVMNDKIGPVNNSSITGDFAYIMQLNTKSKLALGLSGGINIFQARLSSLKLDQQNDPLFQNNINNRVTPNFGVGAYYSRERFYAGISVPNLIQNSYAGNISNNNVIIGKEQRHYFLIAGTVLNLSKTIAFKPTTLVKITTANPVQADLTASFIFNNKLLVGVMARTGDAFGILLGLNVNEQLHIGYSYDASYALRTYKYNQGSHELILRYDFIYSSNKQIHSPRYF